MKSHVILLASAVLLGAAGAAAADEKSDTTKAGRLTETLMVKDVQGGFAGFTGTQYTVEPSGKWTVASVFNKKIEVKRKGELTREQMDALAKELAKYGLSKLAGKKASGGMANPHVVTVKYGKREATLVLGTGEALPKPDTSSVGGRFGGIVSALRTHLKEVKKDETKDK